MAQGYGGYTYADFGTVDGEPEVHADGEIWTQTMWDLRQRLIADLGVATGTSHLRRLMTTAMRLSPPNPSFLDLRNAILQARGRGAAGRHERDLAGLRQARDGLLRLDDERASDLAPIADTHVPPAPGDPTGTAVGHDHRHADGRPGGGRGAGVVHRSRHRHRPGAVGDDGRGRGVRASRACRRARTRCCACAAPATSGQAANVAVAPSPAVTTRNFSLQRNVASPASGRGHRGPDRAGLQRQRLRPGGAHRRRSGARLGHERPRIRPRREGGRRRARSGDEPDRGRDRPERGLRRRRHGEPRPVRGAGLDDRRRLHDDRVRDVHAGDLDRNNAVALSSVPTGVRYLKLVAKTAQSDAGSGDEFIDVDRAAGVRDADATPAAPHPRPAAGRRAPAAAPPPPPVVTPPPPPPPPAGLGRRTARRRCSGCRARRCRSSARACGSGWRCTSEACTASARATVRVPATRGHRAKTYTLTAARAVSIAKGASKVLAAKLPALARARDPPRAHGAQARERARHAEREGRRRQRRVADAGGAAQALSSSRARAIASAAGPI